MQLRSTTAKRVLVTLTTVFLTTTATVGAARAGDTFLLVEDLPADATWVADGIVAGEPEIEEFCVGEVIQPEGTRHQPYHTDLDAFARQHVTTSTTEGAAARLQRRLNSAVRGCAEAYEEQHPGSTAIFKRYREREIADGVAVYGVFTEDGEASRRAARSVSWPRPFPALADSGSKSTAPATGARAPAGPRRSGSPAPTTGTGWFC